MSLAARTPAFILFALTLPLTAQQAGPSSRTAPPAKKSMAIKAAATSSAATSPATTQLPVTRVSLYKNGVGFFEHSGRVTGDQSVSIDFTSAQLNDVLQSLTAIDLNGGRISGAGYNSTTPLDEQLKTLPLGLNESPTATDFYNAIRGALVSVTGSGAPFTGRVLSLDVHPGSDDSDNKKSTPERRTLTIIASNGSVRSLDLTANTQVQVLDNTLHTDLNRYLQLLDSNRNQGLRHLTLRDLGTGARDLRVSYISEVPIWKSTYRILFTDAGANAAQTATLQGWSVVDNTTGEDWNDVQLSLIAGAPQSFIQPLSVPLYSRRPTIPISQEAQLTPQTHESGDFTPSPKVTAAPPPPPPMAYGVGSGTGGGLGVGSGGNMGGGLRRVSPNANASASVISGDSMDSLSDDSGKLLSELRRIDGPSAAPEGGQIYINGFTGGQLPPRAYQAFAESSILPGATTSAFDDFFEYKLTQPVTILKNESALVPILQTKIDAERVTLWSATHPVPLRALWITNTSDLTLDRGSFSIVENGNFAGEGLLDPVHPKERRLLSYAADQAVRVTTSERSPDSHITEFIIKDGWLRQISADSRSVEYTVHNAAPDSRTVVIERPLATGWLLSSTSTKPEETTSTVNRYRAVTAPGGTATVHIDETRMHDQNWHLIETDDNQFNIILHNAAPSPQLIAQIQPILDAKHAVADLDRQYHDKQNAINVLVSDQARLRNNLAALKDTPEQRTLATRYTSELTAQEDQLASLRKGLDALKTKSEAAQQTLNEKIANTTIDLKL